jgi:tetraacyldisaccharide 4'-kinase
VIKQSTKKERQGAWLWSVNPLSLVLWPLSVVFCLLVYIRQALYKRNWLQSTRIGKPVIVVGNISVGGNGKTPVVHSLVQLLKAKGYQPAILTRGYKSDYEAHTVLLKPSETSDRAGDEANMLSELCHCPIGVGADRVKTGSELLQQFPDIDVIITDDGLQHYALARDMEIIVLREIALGNRFCLPAGPLREPLRRLQRCDIVLNRDSADVTEKLGECWNLVQPEMKRELASFRGQKVIALAAIGFPEAFFDALRAQGVELEARAFSDHHAFCAHDIPDDNGLPLLITHKDAVKIRAFANQNIWVVPLELTLSDDLQYQFLTTLESKING